MAMAVISAHPCWGSVPMVCYPDLRNDRLYAHAPTYAGQRPVSGIVGVLAQYAARDATHLPRAPTTTWPSSDSVAG
jgi:hypothetical protein